MQNSKIAIGAASLVVFGLAVGYALGRRAGADARGPPSDESAVVATFEGGVVTANELRAAIDEQGPLLRQELTGAAGRKRLAQELVRQKLMEQGAAAKGYDQAPEFLRERRRALVTLYLRKELEEPLARHTPTDAELQDYLDRHRAEYAQPERVRIAHIFLAAPAGDGAARKKKLAEAQAILQKLSRTRDYYAFATAARERSENAATKAFGGDLPLLSRPELEARLGREVADAAFELRGTEVLADRVVEVPAGFHLIKLRARVEATNADLANLRGLLRGKVAAEIRSKQEQEFFTALEKKAGVQFDEAALAAVQVAPATGKAVSSASGGR
jgi:parvulin-like peptidyl-prolyl cis-trans isomerase-like protein